MTFLAQQADFEGSLDTPERFNPSHTWTHLFANSLDTAELWACCAGLVNKDLRRSRNFICICFCAIIVTQVFLKLLKMQFCLLKFRLNKIKY